MSLDTSTLYTVATMIAALLGMMLLFFGFQERIAALKWWGSAYLVGAVSVALWTFGATRFGDTFALALNATGFLTRDSRVVERKKYGRAKARRSFQFSKR